LAEASLRTKADRVRQGIPDIDIIDIEIDNDIDIVFYMSITEHSSLSNLIAVMIRVLKSMLRHIHWCKKTGYFFTQIQHYSSILAFFTS